MKNKKRSLSSFCHPVCCQLQPSGSCFAPEETRAVPLCLASNRPREPPSPEEPGVLRCGSKELAEETDIILLIKALSWQLLHPAWYQ